MRWDELKRQAASTIEAHPEDWTWVPDRSWRVPAQVADCMFRCGVPPVAEHDSHTWGTRRGRRWYGRCLNHLAPYYRLSHDGTTVEAAVRVDSPAGQRGWTK